MLGIASDLISILDIAYSRKVFIDLQLQFINHRSGACCLQACSMTARVLASGASASGVNAQGQCLSGVVRGSTAELSQQVVDRFLSV